ncbi:hypothetical protein J4Q44_G00326130 [Coregonus suidteri]|uniref:FZ domain-containing protein n=1 Tax=Coregonus suidteri TaxID=861788 RepID=A0AAN8L129_9TELE
MRLPNLLGHDSLKEAQQQSAAWLPLVSKLCHLDTNKLLCSLFAPVCQPEGPVRPCRGLCEAVRDGCLPVMSAFGFPWPDMFNCTGFPRGTHLCIHTTTRDSQHAQKGEEEGHEEASEVWLRRERQTSRTTSARVHMPLNCVSGVCLWRGVTAG